MDGLRRFLAVLSVAAIFAVPMAASPATAPEHVGEQVVAHVRSVLPLGARHDAVAAAPAAAARQTEAPDDAVPGIPIFARRGELELTPPAERVRLIGYHESWYRGALALAPVGELLDNHNPTRVHAPEDAEGPEYVIMASRGRPAPATSAVDVAVDAGVPIASPVDGTVTAVHDYRLYGQHPDVRIEIAPDERPDLRLILIHVDGVTVEPGDVLVAGETQVAGTGLHFPFASHIDRHVDGPVGPHVHIELHEVEAPLSGTEQPDPDVAVATPR